MFEILFFIILNLFGACNFGFVISAVYLQYGRIKFLKFASCFRQGITNFPVDYFFAKKKRECILKAGHLIILRLNYMRRSLT
jgi:hypothetical protein